MILGKVPNYFVTFNPIEMEIILFHIEKKNFVNILVFELYLFDRLIVVVSTLDQKIIFQNECCNFRSSE